MVMQRYDPFQGAASLRTLMDQLTDQTMQRAFGEEDTYILPALDISESDDAYTVTVSLPGIKPEDIDITAHNNRVTIRGEAQQEEEEQGTHYLIRERRVLSFERTFTLPTAVDASKAEATTENGVLKITIPKSDSDKPKKINIKNLVPFLHR